MPVLREWVTSKQVNVEDYERANITLKGARSVVIIY